jgi:hypothetical protein
MTTATRLEQRKSGRMAQVATTVVARVPADQWFSYLLPIRTVLLRSDT